MIENHVFDFCINNLKCKNRIIKKWNNKKFDNSSK